MRVYKVNVPLNDEWHKLRVLNGLDGLLHVAEQYPEAEVPGGTLQLWYFVNDEDNERGTQLVEIKVFGTGHSMPEGLHHIGSVVTWRGRLVWHVMAREACDGS